uniref:Ig-like domain-containing protein n=1 Tax=Anolis carolinensis TaxID=28377 RepID=A0A803SPC9_ANOCA
MLIQQSLTYPRLAYPTFWIIQRIFDISLFLSLCAATFWPTQLNQSTGTTAEFTCNISNAEVFEDSVNWYKFDANKQPGKLDTRNKNKYEITRLDTQTFRMKILNLERNDSGVYSCILVATHSSLGFTESNHGNLTVTGQNGHFWALSSSVWMWVGPQMGLNGHPVCGAGNLPWGLERSCSRCVAKFQEKTPGQKVERDQGGLKRWKGEEERVEIVLGTQGNVYRKRKNKRVVVCFPGSMAMFQKNSLLTFRPHLWQASSEVVRYGEMKQGRFIRGLSRKFMTFWN